jgi:hypothetical protein
MIFNTACLLLVVAIIPLAANANDANILADVAQLVSELKDWSESYSFRFQFSRLVVGFASSWS